jgi:type I restriction enzyme S subunit
LSEISNILLKSRKWEEYIIGDLCDSVPAKPYICSSVITDGVYPVIQQGENPIIGYTNSIPFKDYMKVIIFGDHTLSVYRPNAPFLISTDGLKILTPKSSINRDFLYYLVCAFKPQPEGYKRHYSILKEISVPVPPLDKQRQIAMILLSVDSKINIEAKMLEKQLLQKYYLLNQMFI